MKEEEKIFLFDLMCKIMRDVNAHFIANDTLSLDQFMDIKNNCMAQTKKKFGVE